MILGGSSAEPHGLGEPAPPGAPNVAIGVTGVGAQEYSVWIVDRMPDLECLARSQWFPRWTYYRRGNLLGAGGLRRYSNIPASTVAFYRREHQDDRITADAIFAHAYGTLNHRSYAYRWRNNLVRELPRLPVPCRPFWSYARLGARLAEIQLGYESYRREPLAVERTPPGPIREDDWRLGRQMRWLDAEHSAIRVNDAITLRGVPERAHEYVVGGYSPVEWIVREYYVRRDKDSGIVNDANEAFSQPSGVRALLERTVAVGIDSAAVMDEIEALPEPGA